MSLTIREKKWRVIPGLLDAELVAILAALWEALIVVARRRELDLKPAVLIP